jgi:peroxiredoxin Q/BCP
MRSPRSSRGKSKGTDMAKLAVGDPAPPFELPDANGTRVSLATQLQSGPVVLVFYVMDNTPG